MTATHSLPANRETSRKEATPAPPTPPRFTIDGDFAMEQHLGNVCSSVRAAVLDRLPERKVQGILLGGGYGRGEGGVFHTEVGDRPYNDLEFYILLSGSTFLNDRRYNDILHQLAEQIGAVARVETEFKITSLARLKNNPVTMFSYDLISGHKLIHGKPNLLARCAHHRESANIPMAEATRLLMNRCSGLLFSRKMMEHELLARGKSDFIVRNIAKAQLAMGDVVLTVFGRYHWSCLERHQRLLKYAISKEMPWLREIQAHHAAGVEFKLHPGYTSESFDDLAARIDELSNLCQQIWLWLERRRLNQPFFSANEYALNPANKCPETSAWRNRMVNLLNFGPQSLLMPGAGRYPRERLYRALALLLWEPSLADKVALRQRVQADLSTNAATFPGLVDAYSSLWLRFR